MKMTGATYLAVFLAALLSGIVVLGVSLIESPELALAIPIVAGAVAVFVIAPFWGVLAIVTDAHHVGRSGHQKLP